MNILHRLRVITLLLLFMLPTITLAASTNVRTYIPKNAYKYLDMVYKEARNLDPTTDPAFYMALIEHESCITLTRKSCWNPAVQYKTRREQGVGFSQITRTWKSNGHIRHDTLAGLRNKHPELRKLTWRNIKQEPLLQIRALILMTMDNQKRLHLVPRQCPRLAMGDAAHNGGIGGTLKERRLCGLKEKCDPNKWFGNVEAIKSVKGHRKVIGKRSFWEINRHHVKDVLKVRKSKYVKWVKANYPGTYGEI